VTETAEILFAPVVIADLRLVVEEMA